MRLSEMRDLVSGASTGLGASIAKYFDAIHYSRERASPDGWINAMRMIVHAAWAPGQPIGSKDIVNYMLDHMNLTLRLLSIPHKRFVFISSIDVYPKHVMGK